MEKPPLTPVQRAATFVGSAFAFLALFGLAAHVEAATLGPLVDRIVGRELTP